MPRVTHVKKARKDNKAQGIKRGQEYWWWGVMSGGRGFKRYSLTKPTRSQLTSSEFWQAVWGLEDGLGKTPESVDDLTSERDNLVSELENIKDETQGKFDNMPQGLQDGDIGQLLQERVDALDSAISEIEGVDCDFEPDEDDSEEKQKEALESHLDEKWGEISDALGNISCS